jgi:hypothetical protein
LNENVVNLQVVPGDHPENVHGDSPRDMEITIVEDEDCRVNDVPMEDIPMEDIRMDDVSMEQIVPSPLGNTDVTVVRSSKYD